MIRSNNSVTGSGQRGVIPSDRGSSQIGNLGTFALLSGALGLTILIASRIFSERKRPGDQAIAQIPPLRAQVAAIPQADPGVGSSQNLPLPPTLKTTLKKPPIEKWGPRSNDAFLASKLGDAIGYGEQGATRLNRNREVLHQNFEYLVLNKKVSGHTIFCEITRGVCNLLDRNARPEVIVDQLIKGWVSYDRDPYSQDRGISPSLQKRLDFLSRGQNYIDLNETGNEAATRMMVIGAMYWRPEDEDKLIEVVLRGGFATHNSPLGFLGGLASSLFMAYALQDRPIDSWIPKLLEITKPEGKALRIAKDVLIQNWTAQDSARFFNEWTHFNDRITRFSNCLARGEMESFRLEDGLNGYSCVLIALDSLIFTLKNMFPPRSRGQGRTELETRPSLMRECIRNPSDRISFIDNLAKRSCLHEGDGSSTGMLSFAFAGAILGDFVVSEPLRSIPSPVFDFGQLSRIFQLDKKYQDLINEILFDGLSPQEKMQLKVKGAQVRISLRPKGLSLVLSSIGLKAFKSRLQSLGIDPMSGALLPISNEIEFIIPYNHTRGQNLFSNIALFFAKVLKTDPKDSYIDDLIEKWQESFEYQYRPWMSFKGDFNSPLRPRGRNTIALSLLSLTPLGRQKLAECRNGIPRNTWHLFPFETETPAPLVDFNEEGLVIKLRKQSEEDDATAQLRSILQDAYGLHFTECLETKQGVTYTASCRIPRFAIPWFLGTLGLDSEGKNLLGCLRDKKAYHSYDSERYTQKMILGAPKGLAMQLIGEALSDLVPNPSGIRVLIHRHPRGDFIVSTQDVLDPESRDRFLNSLKNYIHSIKPILKDRKIQTNKSHFVIRSDHLEDLFHVLEFSKEAKRVFFEQIEAEKKPLQQRFFTFFSKFSVVDSLLTGHLRRKEIQIHLSVAATILDLCKDDEIQRELAKIPTLNDESAISPYLKSNMPKVVVDPVSSNLVLSIPESLDRKEVHGISFGKYLSSIYGIEGQHIDHRENGIRYVYTLQIPEEHVYKFFERDLGLSFLPPEYQLPKIGKMTFYHQLMYSRDPKNFQQFAHAIVSRNPRSWRYRPPKIEMAVQNILTHANRPQRIEKMKTIVRDLFPGSRKVEEMIGGLCVLYTREINSLASNSVLIDQIMQLMQDPFIPVSRKRSALQNICASCPQVCPPGAFIKMQTEYQSLKHPNSDYDQVKISLLTKVQTFKEDIVKDMSEKALPGGVHLFAAALVAWGDLYGLSEEIGKQDPHHRAFLIGNNRRLDFLKETDFEKHYLNSASNLVEIIRGSVEEDLNGSPQDATAYQTKLRDILFDLGRFASDDDLFAEVERLISFNEETEKWTVSEEAIKLLLIDLKILNP